MLKNGHLPSAILLTGEKGIGKATLAYRLARKMLGIKLLPTNNDLFASHVDDDLSVPIKSRISAQIASQGHPDLFVLEKGKNSRTGRYRTEITVGEARELHNFLRLTPADSIFKVAIVDSADEMNMHAANSILKSLEEPPPRTTLILVSNSSGRLLPTIKSRCHKFILKPLLWKDFFAIIQKNNLDLDKEEIQILYEISDGSPGRALEIYENDGISLYRELITVLISAPKTDFLQVHAIADKFFGSGTEHRFTIATQLLLGWILRLVIMQNSNGYSVELIRGETIARKRFISLRGLEDWMQLWEKLNQLFNNTENMHLDRRQVILHAYATVDDFLTV